MKILRNAWYAAAWGDEVTENLMSRTLCGESVLLYRTDKNDVVTIANRCPHRFAALDMGKRVDGANVQCGYHGLEFSPDGKCVYNPFSDAIPQGARLRAYPNVERHGVIWLWPGDPAAADEDLIPDFSFLISPQFATVKGLIPIAANYELVTDNLLDLSHAEFLHAGGLGSEAMKRGIHTVDQKGTTIQSNRWCPDGLAPPAWGHMFGDYDKPVDHWINMRWDAPANMALDVGITPTGRSRDEGIWVWNTDLLTPETEHSTHYFWGISRAYAVDDPKYDEMWRQATKIAFEGQDAPMISRVQQMMGSQELEELNPIYLAGDAGALRARRVLRELIEREESDRPTQR